MSFYTIDRPIQPSVTLPTLEFTLQHGMIANIEDDNTIILMPTVYGEWLAHLQCLLPQYACTRFTITRSKTHGAESRAWLLHLYNQSELLQTLFLKIYRPELSSATYIPVIAAMQHEVTQAIIPVFAANNRQILMQYAPVPTLDVYAKQLQAKSITVASIMQCSRLLLRAICNIHAKNMVHLDIKPQNVLCTDEGTCIDFSAAEYSGNIPAVNAYIRSTRHFKGTPMFTSPDHIRGNLHLSSDVFSAAQTILYLTRGYTLCGRESDTEVFQFLETLDTLDSMNQAKIHLLVRRAIQGFLRPLADVLCEMTYVDPEQRLSAPMALQELERISLKNDDQ